MADEHKRKRLGNKPTNLRNDAPSHSAVLLKSILSGGPTPLSPGLSALKPKKSEANAIGSILEKALDVRHISKDASRYSGFNLWPELVGPEIARVAEPLRMVRGNVLQLRVVDPVWAQELSMRKTEILDKISSGVLGSVVEDIQCIIEGPKPKRRP